MNEKEMETDISWTAIARAVGDAERETLEAADAYGRAKERLEQSRSADPAEAEAVGYSAALVEAAEARDDLGEKAVWLFKTRRYAERQGVAYDVWSLARAKREAEEPARRD